MNRLFVNNGALYRLLRTIIQGVIGVIIANIDLIIGTFQISTPWKAVIVALVMAILSPIMAAMGTTEMDKGELPADYFEDDEDYEEEDFEVDDDE